MTGDLSPKALEIGAAVAPFFHHGRRPDFWADGEVRVFLADMHRQTTIAGCVAACREKFGAERTPSKSAVQRFWAVLDQVRAKSRKRLP